MFCRFQQLSEIVCFVSDRYKCDTLIGILKQIKIKREDMDAIIDVKKLLVS